MKASQAFIATKCDKGHVHRYDRFYDKLFSNFIPNTLLEVGVKNGHSLSSWRLMFPNCEITGIDITNREISQKMVDFTQANIIIADSTKPQIIEKLNDNYDIIIDDGSHYYKDIMRTFKNLHTKFNRYYIIEDYFYDVDMARKFITSFGFSKITFQKSKKSNIKIPDRVIFKHKTTKSFRTIDQNFIIIER